LKNDINVQRIKNVKNAYVLERVQNVLNVPNNSDEREHSSMLG